ncbi:MAG: hypothetical protein KC457_04325 [Myxococcales bacterium]|nr:hypothetical protein [Myxococcales bacterium]
MKDDVLRGFIAACKPEEPVSPHDHRHFDFDAAELRLRGAPWRERLTKVIRLASEPSAQLVTGLRGSGKTTELRQLQETLVQAGYHVVMADAGQWLGDDRPLETEDLMLALVLALYPEGKPEGVKTWVREWANKAQNFFKSDVELSGDAESVRLQLTTDETVFERVAKQLRERDGLRRQVHSLLADAGEASREAGEELVILLDGAEKRAVGDLHEHARRAEFHNHWFGSFILRGRDLKPPVHVVYTVPPFMVRRGAELAANFGSELHFLPMVRVYDRRSSLDRAGVEAMTRALFKRIPAEHFADAVTPRWLAAQSGGYFRDLLRFVTEMVYQVGHEPQFTRAHAEAAVSRIRQTYLEALVREDKQVLARVHPSKAFPDEESAQLRMDSLLQGFKMFRYHNGEAWYDAHPLCWAELGFADDLPSWEQLAEIHG